MLVKVRADSSPRPACGETVYLRANPARVHLFDAEGRRVAVGQRRWDG